MKLDDCNWMQVEEYLKHDDRIMLIVGACEQHGYLSLMTDIRIPVEMAVATGRQTGVMVAPPLNFGISPAFLTYPGTISLRISTFLDVVEDMVRSLYGVGFRRMLFVNGHGGNNGATARLVELANALPGLKSAWYSWWIAPGVTAAAAKHGLVTNHANWIEAFSFTRVAEMPEGVKESPAVRTLLNAQENRATYVDGVYGGPYKAGLDVMDDLFAAGVAEIVDLLHF